METITTFITLLTAEGLTEVPALVKVSQVGPTTVILAAKVGNAKKFKGFADLTNKVKNAVAVAPGVVN